MSDTQQVRIDKWLWAVRLFKTRALAADSCKKGRIIVNDTQAKPSRMIKIGDIISIKKTPITYKFEVLDLIEKRIGAKLTSNFLKDITPASEIEILNMQRNMMWMKRDKGTGRPTKKDRRDIDDFFSDENWEELQ